MSEIKVSKVLQQLYDYARQLGAHSGDARSLTGERFLVAVFDYVSGAIPEIDPEEIQAMSDLIEKAGYRPEILRPYLLKEAKKASSYIDRLYLQQKQFQASNQASNNSCSELSATMLLQQVMEDPPATVLKYQNVQAPPEEEEDEDMDDLGYVLEEDDDEEEDNPAPSDPKVAIANLTDEVRTVRETLLSSLFGQDNAVNVFTAGYFQAVLQAMTEKKRTRPRATFLFAGPPGVGKTFLAEKAAEALGLPFMRFDMSEYVDREANIEFCGSDKVYKNGKAGNVTGFVEEHPQCVLLFDEIEKAHISVIHLFLQLLDAGRLRDNYTDTEVSFTDTILIFTTNAGKQLYEQEELGDFSGLPRKVILNALQKDTNPDTGAPFFPAAICSRFASGNVVMFNHIGAYHLREIARREVLRQAENFSQTTSIHVQIDERVYTALLFAEGGAADARTIRSRSESFFDEELFELFRLVASEKSPYSIPGMEAISIQVALPEDPQIQALFHPEEDLELLVFSSRDLHWEVPGCRIHVAGTQAKAMELLRERPIRAVLMDMNLDPGSTGYLNVEDVDSESRDFFRYVRESDRELPVYLLQSPEQPLDPEERVSFLRLGIRGVVTLEKDMAPALGTICESIHQQNSMSYLAKANKLITFETAQTVSPDGKTACIRLFDFKLHTAVDAEDSRNILGNVSKPDVRFDRVIGAEDAKKELRYFVEYLKDPKKYRGTGVRPPKGVILYGPPGTGKTMLAKAMACEADVTFINAEGNQFLQRYVGEGKDRVHELFRIARKYAPSILFVDEIDAIARERRGGDNATVNGEDVLTAFLAEMDGFVSDPAKPVFVLAATNFDVEPGRAKSLDPALMRRFDRRIYIDLPNREERTRFIQGKLEGNAAFTVSQDQVHNLAIRSTGMSLAELESVVELALRSAIRDGNCQVTDSVLEEAFETFNNGEVKKWSPALLERVAHHEAGHAYLYWKSGDTPAYVTIVARADHGGYMQHDDKEGDALRTRQDLLNLIRTSLGGRASEIVFYGKEDGISTGAAGDLAKATAIAQQIVCTYGMEEGFGLAVIDPQAAQTGELSVQVREAVNRILDQQMQEAIAQISQGKAAIEALVQALMSQNHLTGPEIADVFQRAQSLCV